MKQLGSKSMTSKKGRDGDGHLTHISLRLHFVAKASCPYSPWKPTGAFPNFLWTQTWYNEDGSLVEGKMFYHWFWGQSQLLLLQMLLDSSNQVSAQGERGALPFRMPPYSDISRPACCPS